MIDEPVSAIKNYLKSDLMLTLSPSFLVGLDFFIFSLLISIKSLKRISSCCLDINTIFYKIAEKLLSSKIIDNFDFGVILIGKRNSTRVLTKDNIMEVNFNGGK